MAGTLAWGAAAAPADSGRVSTPAMTDFSVGLPRTRSRELLGVRASKAIVPVRPSASVATGASFVEIEPASATLAAEIASERVRTNDWIERPGVTVMRASQVPPSSVHPRKSVRAPVFAADAVMEEEEAFGIVFVLDRPQPRVILAPERILPVWLEKVGLPHIRADAGQELADFVHRQVHRVELASCGLRIRLMAGNAGIGGLSQCVADHEREGVDDRRVHRRVLRPGDRVGRGARKPLVAMQRHLLMLRRRKQRIRETLAPVGIEERSRQPGGLVGGPDRARLSEVAGPENIVHGRALAIVGDDEAW